MNDECVTEYNNLKLQKKVRCIFFRMSDSAKEIIVDSQYDRSDDRAADYEKFIGTLPRDDCRYVVFDFEFDTDGGLRNKILFINWAPETSKIKSKMLYAASKDAFKKKLVGLSIEVQATDLSEVAYQEVLDKCLALAR